MANYAKFNFINASSGAVYAKFKAIAGLESATLDDTVSLSDEILLSVSREKVEHSDSINISDSIEINVTLEKVLHPDIVTLSDAIELSTAKRMIEGDTVTLSDEILLNLSLEKAQLNDTVNLSDILDIIVTTREVKDINNDIRAIAEVIKDINSKFNSVIEVLSDCENYFNMVVPIISDVVNDFRSQALSVNNVRNDFRLIADWQVAADGSFQSLGKEYVKVYINSVEQTDADIDSISITKVLNESSTAVVDLGRPFDNTKPSMESTVEIKYNEWVLFKGYITTITPTDNPESIRINCKDEYWKQNKINKYFFVGHQPQDNKEKYYNTIKEALSTELGYSVEVGDFIPETIELFGEKSSDCISILIQGCGNYGWYYDKSTNKKLWIAGDGNIINIDAQSIGKNMGLYQIIRHNFTETVEGIVNKLRVQMGEKVIREFNDKGGAKTYSGFRFDWYSKSARPDWNFSDEKLIKEGILGYGWNYHPSEDADTYKDVFKKYKLPLLPSRLESWSDRKEPEVMLYSRNSSVIVTSGYTLDYKNGIIYFSSPQLEYITNNNGEVIKLRRANVKVTLEKRDFYSYTVNPTEDPEADESNPLMFITDKKGTYADTVFGILNLTQLSMQEGGIHINSEGEEIFIPSWDDTNFAKDLADWELSKTANKVVSGSIELTLDNVCYNNIELSKRIMIDNIIENPLNIESMTYNLRDFTVSLNLKSFDSYKREISLPSRGE